MSILLRPKLSATDSALLTTCAAVAVALSIESVSGKETQIKWVNDVFMEGKKYAGSLPKHPCHWKTAGLIMLSSASVSM